MSVLDEIDIQNPKPETFDQVAERTAEALLEGRKEQRKNGVMLGDKNKSTQLRKFYDEWVRWETKVRQNKAEFHALLPHIRMLNSRVAYANGRNLVDTTFAKMHRTLLDQVTEPQHFQNAKLFFEAVMGFYKKLVTENNKKD